MTNFFDFAANEPQINDISSFRVARTILYPEGWTTYQPLTQLDWSAPPLQYPDPGSLDAVPGVYSFVVQPGVADHPASAHVMYVGKTNNLKRRYREYRTKKKVRTHMQKMKKWTGWLWFYYSEVPTQVRPELVEAQLLKALLPPYNRAFPGDVQGFVDAVFS